MVLFFNVTKGEIAQHEFFLLPKYFQKVIGCRCVYLLERIKWTSYSEFDSSVSPTIPGHIWKQIFSIRENDTVF